MRKIIEFFVGRSLLVNLITLMVIIVGSASAYMLKKDTFPEVDFETIMVSVSYPKSTPEDVERLITLDMERALKEVDGVKELNALSLEGRSISYIKVDPDYDIDKVLEDTKNAVDRVNDLPEEAEEPEVIKFVNTQRSIIKVALMGKDHDEVRRVSKKLRDKIEQISGVAKVELEGYRETDIYVEVSPDKLNQYQITIGEVATAIAERNLSLSGGKIETSREDFLIRTVGEFKNKDDVGNVVVRSNNSGAQVKISDIASIHQELEDDSVVERAQGNEAIFVNVKKAFTADVLKITDKVKVVVEQHFKDEPSNLEYKYVDDLSFFVKRRLGVLTNNGLFGLLLVLGCLLLFMNFRISVITAMGAPFAFLTALALMDSFGLSINLISMFALILVLGMLVDDSIIVSENFYHNLETGMKPKMAAIKAAMNTVKPVTATIITTMLAFGSLFFMGGIMGKFLWPVPAVVILCLLASWVECFLILPGHLADFVKLSKRHVGKRRWYDPLADIYTKILGKCLKHYIITALSFFIILGLSVLVIKTMRFELFPGDDVRTVFVNLKGKVGTPLERTTEIVERIEKVVMENTRPEDELKAIRGIVGRQLKNHGGSRNGSHYASFILYLSDPSERLRSTDDIVNDLTGKIQAVSAGFEVSTEKQAGGPPKGRALEVQLRGDDLQTLKEAALKVQTAVNEIDGVLSTELDYEDGKVQVIIDVNEDEAKRLGLSTTRIARAVRLAYAGDSITEIKGSEEDIEIKIRLDAKTRSDVDSISEMYILNNVGRRIKVSQVAKIYTEKGAFVIRRFDRKRTISLYGDLDRKKLTPVALTSEARPFVKDILKDYPTITYEFGGENKDTKESMVRLGRAAMIAFFSIFVILVAMFSSLGQPVVIMSAIPLGLIGVVLTFKTMGLAFGFMAMMGIVGLVGVVVNDSIVLVNFINIRRLQESDLLTAVSEAARSRFRPIILTTFTTVAGLLPIAHAKGGDPFLKPMALSFAYGLLFSTAVTLIFIPCAYLIYYKTRTLAYSLINKIMISSKEE